MTFILNRIKHFTKEGIMKSRKLIIMPKQKLKINLPKMSKDIKQIKIIEDFKIVTLIQGIFYS